MQHLQVGLAPKTLSTTRPSQSSLERACSSDQPDLGSADLTSDDSQTIRSRRQPECVLANIAAGDDTSVERDLLVPVCLTACCAWCHSL